MNLPKVFLGLIGCLVAASLSGCIVVADSGPDTGSITVDVTIDDLQDPFDCDALLVEEIEIVVVDNRHDEITRNTVRCDDFGVTFVDVPPGSYDVEVTLLDGGQPITDTLIIPDVGVRAGEGDTYTVNFPASSIDP